MLVARTLNETPVRVDLRPPPSVHLHGAPLCENSALAALSVQVSLEAGPPNLFLHLAQESLKPAQVLMTRLTGYNTSCDNCR